MTPRSSRPSFFHRRPLHSWPCDGPWPCSARNSTVYRAASRPQSGWAARHASYASRAVRGAGSGDGPHMNAGASRTKGRWQSAHASTASACRRSAGLTPDFQAAQLSGVGSAAAAASRAARRSSSARAIAAISSGVRNRPARCLTDSPSR
ncbi:hypothetical protein ACFWMT_26470 [Streptomyces sp. NPDC058368]|uniref:hypothetical protein n=1 Tax=Streptomyces sp. NPDC058368 TaxID=3346461 RepID=UPI0036619BC9